LRRRKRPIPAQVPPMMKAGIAPFLLRAPDIAMSARPRDALAAAVKMMLRGMGLGYREQRKRKTKKDSAENSTHDSTPTVWKSR
jgi:hypothetical protein